MIWLPTAYLLLGLGFIPYAWISVLPRIDDDARGASLGFRLLLIPSIVLLWPVLLRRDLQHRRAA